MFTFNKAETSQMYCGIIVVSTKFTTSTTHENHAQQVAETPATGSRLRGTWEILTREEMGCTMLKHQKYGSFRFRHEISMFHQAETDRFFKKG